MAQWIRCFPPKEKIPGSSPGGGGFFWRNLCKKEKSIKKAFDGFYLFVFATKNNQLIIQFCHLIIKNNIIILFNYRQRMYFSNKSFSLYFLSVFEFS